MSGPLQIEDLLENNRRWAEKKKQKDPEFFHRLTVQQKPRFLWIGCSDSRVPSNQLIDLPPGEVFVHRNVANVAHPTDMNLMSVLEYAVDVLQVEHIIVCGHYGCGGVEAALSPARLPGIADFWIEPIRDLYRESREELDSLPENARCDRLCELNVQAQVTNVVHSGLIHKAWERKQKLSVHGWIYRLADGLIRDLGVTRLG